MKKRLLKIILSVYIIFVSSFSIISSQQSINIGYIDYSKVFLDFRYTKSVQTVIQKRQSEIEKLVVDAKKSGKTDKEINELRAKEEKKLGEYVEKARQDIKNKILKEVENIAKIKKLSVVIEKKIRIWGGIDITDEVLKNLNK
uniref:OmpH family outer membrane protein n=1 Tax=Dictyoglomus thermophilum TaxID=14 RepID=A0A7C3RWK5_DICTH